MVIRFAGDSGDGMQLTGARFTDASALFGNDLATCPTSRPRSGPRPAPWPASRPSRSTSRTTTSSRPGDAPDVLVAMNPAALKANIGDLPAGRHAHRQHRRLRRADLRKAGYATEPPHRRQPRRRTRSYEVPMTSLTMEAVKAGRGQAARRRALARTSSPSAWSSWLYNRPMEPTLEWIRRSSPRSPGRSTPTPRLQGRLQLRRNGRALRVDYQVRPAQARRPATYTNITGNTALGLGTGRRARTRPTCRSSSARTPSPRPPTSSTSSPSTRTSASGPCRPRTRSPASARPSAPPSAVPRRHHHERARASTSRPRPWAWR